MITRSEFVRGVTCTKGCARWNGKKEHKSKMTERLSQMSWDRNRKDEEEKKMLIRQHRGDAVWEQEEKDHSLPMINECNNWRRPFELEL